MSKAIQGLAMIGSAVGVMTVAAILGSTGVGAVAIPFLIHMTEALVVGGIAMEAGAIAQALTGNRGMAITTRQAAALRQVVYGQRRVPGVEVYRSTTGKQKDQFNYIIVLAGHEIDSIVNLYLDGRQVFWQVGSSGNVTRNGINFGGSADGGTYYGPNGTSYNFGGAVYCEARFGDQAEGDVIAAMTANDSNWAASGGQSPWLGGCAYIYLKCEYNTSLFPSEPEIRITINGKNNIYDPRTGETGFSNNWALCVADVLTDPVFGLGDSQSNINQAQLIAAANVCDEEIAIPITTPSSYSGVVPSSGTLAITFTDADYAGDVGVAGPDGAITDYTVSRSGTSITYTFSSDDAGDDVTINYNANGYERQYCLNWNYDSGLAPGDVLAQMMLGAAGAISRAGGQKFIWPAYWIGPSFTFDQKSLVATPSWMPKRKAQDLWNRITGTYIAPNYPYNVAGNLYDSNGYYNGETQDNFPFAFQPTSVPMYAQDELHGYSASLYTFMSQIPSTSPYSIVLPMPVSSGSVTVLNAKTGASLSFTSTLTDGVTTLTFDSSLAGVNVKISYDVYDQWLAQDLGKPLPKDIALQSVLSIFQAQRVFKIMLLRNRYQGAGVLSMFLYAWQMQQKDVMQFSMPTLGMSGRYLEVDKVGLRQMQGEDGNPPSLYVEVPVKETDPGIYETNLEEMLSVYDVPSGLTSSGTTPVAPTDLTVVSNNSTAVLGADGTVIPRLALSWTAAGDPSVISVEVQYARVVSGVAGPWLDAPLVAATQSSTFVQGIIAGAVYNVRIRAARFNGAVSAWLEVDNTTAAVTASLVVYNGQPVATAGTLTSIASGSTAQISIANFTPAYGPVSGNPCTPSPNFLNSLEQGQLYDVYYIDPLFLGGTITPIATMNSADYLNKPGYFLIGSIVTATASAVYQPSTYNDLGSNATLSPGAAIDGNLGTYATAKSTNQNVVGSEHVLTVTGTLPGTSSPSISFTDANFISDAGVMGPTLPITDYTVSILGSTITYTFGDDDAGANITISYNAISSSTLESFLSEIIYSGFPAVVVGSGKMLNVSVAGTLMNHGSVGATASIVLVNASTGSTTTLSSTSTTFAQTDITESIASGTNLADLSVIISSTPPPTADGSIAGDGWGYQVYEIYIE